MLQSRNVFPVRFLPVRHKVGYFTERYAVSIGYSPLRNHETQGFLPAGRCPCPAAGYFLFGDVTVTDKEVIGNVFPFNGFPCGTGGEGREAVGKQRIGRLTGDDAVVWREFDEHVLQSCTGRVP